jgi:hypothetical protein
MPKMPHEEPPMAKLPPQQLPKDIPAKTLKELEPAPVSIKFE